MTNRQLALLARLEAWFNANGHASALDAARAMQMPPEAAQAVVALGVSAGRFILVGREVYTRDRFDQLVEGLRGKLGDTFFKPRELREALDESRAWVDHFAETLGRKGLLERGADGWRLQQGP